MRFTRMTPLVHSISEACSLTRTGRTSIYKAIKDGELRALKRGRRTLILAEDLRRWLETLPSIAATQSASSRANGQRDARCSVAVPVAEEGVR